MSSLQQTLAELVAIDSTSSRPNGPIISVLEARLRSAGFECERLGYRDEAGVEKLNLVATRGGGQPELALVAHTDCVPFDPSWSEALRLTERDGKLYGRGACDTKAFIACALQAVEQAPRALPRALRVIFTADEEVGCIGAKQLVQASKGQARHAIIGEPTSLTPIRANKGYCLAEVELVGREGHSAYPDSGPSAIFRAGRFLHRLERLALTSLRAEVDPAFTPPFTSLNVGMISGGKAKNIIPGSCRFTLEWRPIPSQPLDKVLSLLEQIRGELAAEEPGFEVVIRPLRLDPGAHTPESAEVVRFLVAESGNASSTVPFGTEAAQLAALGASAVVFGPGDIQVAHRTGEFVPVTELHRCAQMLERAIAHFCGSAAPAR